MTPTFSIIVPAFEAEAYLAQCLDSALEQDIGAERFEIVVVDDCSADGTFAMAEEYARRHPNIRAARTAANGGPGVGRNLGVELARGEWILFLDSDDRLDRQALSRLDAFIAANQDCDAVRFNWRYRDGGGGEKFAYFADKQELLGKYLSLCMDGSVIYVAMRRSLLAEQEIHFLPGYHEDVDYLLKVYWTARRVGCLDAVLYEKHQRPGSIVNTISERHLEGFFRAWREIGEFAAARAGAGLPDWRDHYRKGLVGVVATRIREIFRR